MSIPKDLQSCLSVNTPNQLILVDEQYVHECQNENEDLYDILIKEPTYIKQESINYDHPSTLDLVKPNSLSHSYGAHQNQQQSSTHNHSLSHPKENSNQNIGAQKVERTVKCKCSKTKCQKNYCDCFKAGLPCTAQCVCIDCCNDEKNHKLLKLKRIQGTGCRCKKSKCLKKYCQCHNAGKKCSKQCMCQDCENIGEKNFPEQVLELAEPHKKQKQEVDQLEMILVSKESSKFLFDFL